MQIGSKGRARTADRTTFYLGKELPIALRPLLCKAYGLPEDCADVAIFVAIVNDSPIFRAIPEPTQEK